MAAGTTDRVHWPGLDGLRGIAALAVVIFHANLGPAVNGYVGVDVFFALSGFLITSILLGEIARHRTVRLRRFYVRRLLRLYPALVAASLLVVAAGVVAGNLPEVLPGVGAALIYIANWWQGLGRPMPLLEHTWTLAIEEHFYFVWPLLLLGLTAARRWMRLVAGGIALALLIIIFTPWAEPIDGVRDSYLRGFPIVWGSLLAALWQWRPSLLPRRIAGAVGTWAALGLVGVLVVPWTLPEQWLTGPASVTGALSVLVLAGVVAAPVSHGSRWLSWSLLRWFGARSYGLYLYHFPILSVLRHHIDVGPLEARMLVGIGLSIVAAWASFKWWEAPFLKLKDREQKQLPASV